MGWLVLAQTVAGCVWLVADRLEELAFGCHSLDPLGMPIPFDRFRFLNDTGNPRKLVNNGASPIEYQVEDDPIAVLAPGAAVGIDSDAQEIAVRRQDETAPAVPITIEILS